MGGKYRQMASYEARLQREVTTVTSPTGSGWVLLIWVDRCKCCNQLVADKIGQGKPTLPQGNHPWATEKQRRHKFKKR